MTGNETAGKAAKEPWANPEWHEAETAAVARARVDLKQVCSTREGRARVYGILRQVDAWGLLRDVAAYIRVEKGAVRRGLNGDEVIMGRCSQVIAEGLWLFDQLQFAVMRVVDGGEQFWKLPPEPTGYEEVVLRGLQQWLDRLAASVVSMNASDLETIAGFAGCGVEGLRRFNASTGVEAARNLGWSVRNAIAEMPYPFLWLGLVQGERPKRIPATGRDRPVRPEETQDDDKRILLAVARGAKTPKAILKSLSGSRDALKPVRIRQRKKDFVLWGLLSNTHGVWTLTKLGEAWVSAMRSSDQATSGSNARGARSASDDVRRSGPKDAR